MITNVGYFLERQANINGNKIAIFDKSANLTFKQLQYFAYNISEKIHNIQADIINEPIIIFSDKDAMQYTALLGTIYSGNFYVPLDTKMPLERLNLILNLLKAKIAITTRDNLDILNKTGFTGKILLLDEIDASQTVQKIHWLQKVIDTDPAYILFTSGSTGIPKGVVISHRAIIDYIEWQCNKFTFNESTVLGNQAPFYFDASMPDIYTPLYSGATLHIIPENLFLLPNKLIEYINLNSINTLIWVPSALITLTTKAFFDIQLIKDLKLVMFCGEAMPNKHLNIWRKYYKHTTFVNLYGPTEAAYACTYFIVNREFSDDEPLPIGKPCENTDIIILTEDNQKAKELEIGELCIRGSSLANGYYNNPEKTREMFVNNPLVSAYEDKIYKTGDLVKYNSRFELEYIGRKDFQIKHMGYRIELGEIETAAYSISKIVQCCAIYDEKRKKIVLYCSTQEEIDAKTIYLELKQKIPKYMLPGEILIENQLPLNANGKINRLYLKKKLDNADGKI